MHGMCMAACAWYKYAWRVHRGVCMVSVCLGEVIQLMPRDSRVIGRALCLASLLLDLA